MDAHGIDIFDEADSDHLVFFVADHFQFQLLPAEDGFFNQDLSDAACRNPATGNSPEFLQIINQTAPRATHGIGRANNHRIAEF